MGNAAKKLSTLENPDESGKILTMPNTATGKTTSTSSLLASMNKKSAAKGKSKVTIIDKKEHYEVVDNFISAKEEFKNAEASLEIATANVLDISSQWYSGQKGYDSSVKLKGTTELITASYRNQFTGIDYDKKDELEQELGEDFGKFFTEKRDITLLKTDDETIEKLITMLGDDFAEIFDVRLTLKVNERMNELQFDLPESVKPFVKQYKASVK